MRLENKVAVISGGARGQGAVEAKLFAGEGARVVFGDILDDEGLKVEAQIREAGGEATYVHLDVTVEADWQQAMDTAVSKYGRLDILVNNAAIVPRDGSGAGNTIESTTADIWDRIMAVNTKGVFLGTRFAIPLMRQSGGGSIINISSGAGITPTRGTPAVYAASKGAVRLFTKSTATQHAPDNIRCNSVHPGPIDTEMLTPQKSDEEGNLIPGVMERQVPLGRRGRPDEVAYGVLYLASDESSYVTGSELVIDGGRTAQ